MTKNKAEDKHCPACTNAISMGFLFKICNQSLSSKINCKDLQKQFLHGKINANQVIQRIKNSARENPELMADIEDIERIRKTKHIES